MTTQPSPQMERQMKRMSRARISGTFFAVGLFFSLVAAWQR